MGYYPRAARSTQGRCKAQSVDLTAQPGPLLRAKIIDDAAWQKIKAGVYNGFSIGIKAPQVIYDGTAKNGRIAGGKLMEISIVDRPANDAARFTLVKAAVGDEWRDAQTGVVVKAVKCALPDCGCTCMEGSPDPACECDCAFCAAQRDDESQGGSQTMTTDVTKAVWSTAFQNDLPDSSFAYIEPGGEKDKEGKTTPRRLRHFPYKDGKPDPAHVRNALARIPQSTVSEEVKAAALRKVRAAVKDLGIEMSSEGDGDESKEKAVTTDNQKAVASHVEHRHPFKGTHNHEHDDGHGDTRTHVHMHNDDDLTYNLEALHSLFPVLTPIRNATSRVRGKGRRVEYKAITGINTGGLQGLVAEGAAAGIVSTATIDKTAAYKSIGLADTVTYESEWSGLGFVDVKALAVTNLLHAIMQVEENLLLFGQAAMAAAVTGLGESLPSTSVSSGSLTGSSNSLTVTPTFPAGQPVIGFRLYVGTASTGPFYLVGSGNVSAVLSNGQLPGGTLTWLTNGSPLTLTSVPASGTTPPATDGSGNDLSYNGIYTQMWGGSGASLQYVGGALTAAAITKLLQALWNSARGDPDALYCNAQESVKITNLTLGTGTPYQVLVQQDQVSNAAANFRVARFTNPVTGTELPILVHPTIPQGTLLALQKKLLGWYVPTDIPTVWEWDGPQDYIEIDYPPTSSNPLWQAEVRCFGALKLYLPLLQGALYGITNQ